MALLPTRTIAGAASCPHLRQAFAIAVAIACRVAVAFSLRISVFNASRGRSHNLGVVRG